MYRGLSSRVYDASNKNNGSRVSISVDQRPVSHYNGYQKVTSPDVGSQYYAQTMQSPRKSKDLNKMNLMKSKISYLSGSSQKSPDYPTLFPQQLLFLLSDEENNIQYMKKRIESEKAKVDKDFQNLQQQLEHIMQDLKLSIVAQLDQIYRDFIQMYGNLKSMVTEMRNTRKTILSPMNNQSKVINAEQHTSNHQLLQEISQDAEFFKNHQIYEEVNSAHRQRLGPILELTNQIIVVGGYQRTYYSEEQASTITRKLKSKFQNAVNDVFREELRTLIIQADQIIEIDQKEKEENNMLLKGIDDSRSEGGEEFNLFNKDKRQQFRQQVENKPKKSGTDGHPYGFNFGQRKEDSYSANQPRKQKPNRPLSTSQYTRMNSHSSNRHSNYNAGNQEISPVKEHQDEVIHSTLDGGKVASSQQSMTLDWAEEVTLEESRKCRNYNILTSQTIDCLLCGVFVEEGKYIVVGSKDRNIYVYETQTGKFVSKLQGHKASVCSLLSHREFLASGGDVNCSSLILWDPKTWTILSKIQAHEAAISCIVDLMDDYTIATGSYDKKINLYNYRRNELVTSIPTNKAAISCLVLTPNKKLVCSTLDSHLLIFNLIKKGSRVENLQLERVISSCGLVCTMRELALEPNAVVVGNKEGKILMIDVRNGEIVWKYAVGKSSVIQMVVVERKTKPYRPIILSSCHREKALISTKTDSGIVSSINLKGRLNVDFGCGIGPKMVLRNDAVMAIVSQSSIDKQINLYDICIN